MMWSTSEVQFYIFEQLKSRTDERKCCFDSLFSQKAVMTKRGILKIKIRSMLIQNLTDDSTSFFLLRLQYLFYLGRSSSKILFTNKYCVTWKKLQWAFKKLLQLNKFKIKIIFLRFKVQMRRANFHLWRRHWVIQRTLFFVDACACCINTFLQQN